MGESSSSCNNGRPLAIEIQVCPTSSESSSESSSSFNIARPLAYETLVCSICNLPLDSCGWNLFSAWQKDSRWHVRSVEESIESSKSHWSEVREFDCGDEVAEVSNVEVFRTLRKHPKWGTFFMNFGPGDDSMGVMVMGEKFAEGAQGELYDVQIEWWSEYMREQDLRGGTKWILKAFKKGTSLRQLQVQWPQEMLNYIVDAQDIKNPGRAKLHSEVFGGTLLEDGRFAFLMVKEQGDLQSLIDNECIGQNNKKPLSRILMMRAMFEVALGMNELHDWGIVHRDLKASNVLMSSKNCFRVADYECSVGVVGTGFFRAPEILQACKDRVVSSKAEVFTKAADVYSYGMVCYEILTGKLPFEGHPLNDYDLVIKGARPEIPQYVDGWICKLLNACWHSNPASRPSFKKILKVLEANSVVCSLLSIELPARRLHFEIGFGSNGSWMISKRWKLLKLKLKFYLKIILFKIGPHSQNRL